MNKQRPNYNSVRVGDTFAVVRPDRRLLGDNETDEFEAIMKQLLDEQYKLAVVDLGEIDWINSTGLAALYEAQRRFAERGARMCLARVDKRIHNLFIVVGLSMRFETFRRVEDAIAAGVGEPDALVTSAPA
jgi:anti-anti-sigma factor